MSTVTGNEVVDPALGGMTPARTLPPGIGPYQLAWRRLQAQQGRAGLRRAVPGHRDHLPARARVRERHRAHRPQRAACRHRAEPVRPADRADLARQVLPRRRQHRSRRRGAPALRRAQLAPDRGRGDDHHDRPGHHPRHLRRVLPRPGRRADLAGVRADLGLPGVSAGDRARRRAGDQRPRPRASSTSAATRFRSPAIIIGVIYIPYVGKAIRGQVLGLREREFVDAARQQGLGHFRIMFSEILPNVASTIIVFVPLIMANAILTEAGLSFLGAGVRPPNPSWGTMIGEGIGLLPGRGAHDARAGDHARPLRARDQRVRRRAARRARPARQDPDRPLTDGPLRHSAGLLSLIGVLFAISVLTFLIFTAIPASRAPAGRALPDPGDARAHPPPMGLRQADLHPLPADDEADLHRPGHLLHPAGQRRSPDLGVPAGHLVAGHRRRHHLAVGGHPVRAAERLARGPLPRPRR